MIVSSFFIFSFVLFRVLHRLGGTVGLRSDLVLWLWFYFVEQVVCQFLKNRRLNPEDFLTAASPMSDSMPRGISRPTASKTTKVVD
jgi:hypothetical protein